METLYGLPFAVLECPNIKLKKPSWLHMPSAMTVYALVIVSYFLITGGIIYDVIVEPPSVGSMTDEHGHQRPVAFLAYRVNGQYIMEGLASSFLFTMGGLGFIILDRSNAPNIPKLNRFLLLFIGFVSVLLSFFMARVFMRMKLPNITEAGWSGAELNAVGLTTAVLQSRPHTGPGEHLQRHNPAKWHFSTNPTLAHTFGMFLY
ncbi:hypothetical protein JZ751_029785, partial [Albula glossodonta]